MRIGLLIIFLYASHLVMLAKDIKASDKTNGIAYA